MLPKWNWNLDLESLLNCSSPNSWRRAKQQRPWGGTWKPLRCATTWQWYGQRCCWDNVLTELTGQEKSVDYFTGLIFASPNRSMVLAVNRESKYEKMCWGERGDKSCFQRRSLCVSRWVEGCLSGRRRRAAVRSLLYTHEYLYCHMNSVGQRLYVQLKNCSSDTL